MVLRRPQAGGKRYAAVDIPPLDGTTVRFGSTRLGPTPFLTRLIDDNHAVRLEVRVPAAAYSYRRDCTFTGRVSVPCLQAYNPRLRRQPQPLPLSVEDMKLLLEDMLADDQALALVVQAGALSALPDAQAAEAPAVEPVDTPEGGLRLCRSAPYRVWLA